MPAFNELRRELENYLNEGAIEQIHNAYLFAARAHKGQQRKSGDPYITHPLAVAHILAQMRMDAQSIMAAILHDVIEDTPVEKKLLITEFGNEVAELVDGVSKLTQIHFETRVEAQAENFRKMLLAMSKDIRVILVKLADRLHNMRTLSVLSAEKRHRIALETLEIYAPIARRLGMHAFRVEFEDLGFAILYPFRHRVLQEAVRKARRSRKKMIGHVETNIKESLEKNKFPPSLVWSKPKHLYSIYKDMKEKHVSFSEIMDVYTFCVVVDNIDTCYRVLGIIHQLYKPLPERFRDYIALPKSNGYQALHTTVFGPYGFPIEIQIRTVDMDNMADSGIATHWLYNAAEGVVDPAHVRAREWLKRLLDIQESTGNSIEFIENVKIDLFPEEVYVFTPKGDIIELPRGATAVDLAYAIHSDLGNCCIAARIDRRLAPLSTPLANGQTVEVITAPNAQPNPAWLNFVVTGKACSNIRHFLKAQRQNESVSFGKRLLQGALQVFKTKLDNVPNKHIQTVLKQYHYKTLEELLEAIGLGHQMAPLIAQRLTELMSKKNVSETVSSETQLPIVIKGTEGLVVQFAKCCRPIPGDLIMGVFNVGEGITVHVKHCKNLEKMNNQPEKLIPVKWEDNIKATFKTDIRIEAINKPGVLAELATAIAKTKANISDVALNEKDSHFFEVHFSIMVRDRVHLAQVMKRLRASQSVVRLSRHK